MASHQGDQASMMSGDKSHHRDHADHGEQFGGNLPLHGHGRSEIDAVNEHASEEDQIESADETCLDNVYWIAKGDNQGSERNESRRRLDQLRRGQNTQQTLPVLGFAAELAHEHVRGAKIDEPIGDRHETEQQGVFAKHGLAIAAKNNTGNNQPEQAYANSSDDLGARVLKNAPA